MKTLLTIMALSRKYKRNKRSMKRSVFALSEFVVELTTLVARIIIFPFTVYKAIQHYNQSKKKVEKVPKNVVDFLEYKKKHKAS